MRRYTVWAGPGIRPISNLFNFLNKTNFNNPNGNRSAGAYGTITSAQQPREIQFALRYAF